jgi:hypothetical protein
MTANEFREILKNMESDTKATMKKKAKAEQMDDEECVYAIGESTWETRFCNVLGIPTESERVGTATFHAAKYAKLAFWAAVASIVALLK